MANDFKQAGIIEEPQVKPVETGTPIKDVDSPSGSITPQLNHKKQQGIKLVGNNSQLIQFKHRGKDYAFEFVLIDDSPETNWLTIEESSFGKQIITLNIAHPFFDPYTADPKFLEIMEKFAFALALAEVDARASSVDKRIDPSGIRKRMNDSLEAVADVRSANG